MPVAETRRDNDERMKCRGSTQELHAHHNRRLSHWVGRWRGSHQAMQKRKKSPEFATGIELRCCRRQIHARGVRRKEWHSERRVTNTHTSFRSTPWRRSTLAPVVDLHKFLEPVRPQREFVPVRGAPSSPFLALGREHDLLECVKRDAISVP